jgi:long-chain acyl-CoA synthetase
MVDLLAETVRRFRDAPAIHYFGSTISWSEFDEVSDRVASGLLSLGVLPGDRVALLMQNMPQYMLALAAIWKIGAAAVPVNPMLTSKDVGFLLSDSGSKALIGLDSLVARFIADAPQRELPDVIVATSAGAYATQDSAVQGLPPPIAVDAAISWEQLMAAAPEATPFPVVSSADAAVFTYTSGTTGPPKGAINSHSNVVFACRFYEYWAELLPSDVILGIAPLFHITGLVAHMGPAIRTGCALVLAYRFDVHEVVALIERYRPTFTIGSITAFIALMTDADARGSDISSLRTVYSGGAPIAPATVEDFERTFGAYIHNIYGLTEATGPCLAVPRGRRAPVDPTTGALAAGVPVCNVEVRLVREDGTRAGPGEPGEVTMRSPGVVRGYWNRPNETAHAIRDGWLHTGDVAVADEGGWYYVIDRLKDQINASGFKVWPREVEDALIAHDDVVEAAVVGVPDAYRGETVKGFVVLRKGSSATQADLIDFAKGRLAAYKYPREIEIVDELPKTASGKIMRRALRA